MWTINNVREACAEGTAMHNLSRQLILFCILLFGCALFAQPAGAAGMCRAGEIYLNCGQGPHCTTKPAVCCAGKTCGGGMVCAQTARGPECAVSKVTRCGRYTCGEGMACVQTSRGPECAMAGGNAGGRGATGGGAGGGQSAGPVANAGGDRFMQMCPSFIGSERPSHEDCVCMYQAYKKAGMTPDEIEIVTLWALNKDTEANMLVMRWSKQKQDEMQSRLGRVDLNPCMK
jgi:hypothetical protein